MAEPQLTRSGADVPQMAQASDHAENRDLQLSASTTALAPAVVVPADPAFAATLVNRDGLYALGAAKTGAANEQIDGTGVSHIHVAHDLGVATLTDEQYEEKQQLEAHPDRPQDVDTGGLVKQHDTAEAESFDPDIFNTWTHSDQVPKELVKGLENDELWKIIRRFDKQVYHVKATIDGRKRGLRPELEMDLVMSEEQDFSPDRIRLNLERLYISFGVGGAAVVKHIQRVRSWDEFNRTATWCAVYFTFWLLAQVGLLLVGTLFLLTIYPPSRRYIFPQAPLAVVSATSGGLQKPAAGDKVGSKDSLTGAPEAHKGEAVENEAMHFIKGLASVISAVAVNESSKDTALAGMPDLRDVTSIVDDAQNDAADGQNRNEDAAKAPVIQAISKAMHPPFITIALKGLQHTCDNYERLANALDPTSPYPQHLPRIRLAAVFMPVLLLFMFVKAQYMVRGATLFMGIGFFSQPFLSKGWRWYTANHPDWKESISLQRTLLKGVPSNSQLALTLLRIGENYNTPLPPPPQYVGQPPTRSPSPTFEDDLPPVNPDTAARDLSNDDEYADSDQETSVMDDENSDKGRIKQKKQRILGFLKSTAKTAVSAVKNADKVKTKIETQQSKLRQSISSKKDYIDGPSTFRCKSKGKQGWALISNSATDPYVAWVKDNKLSSTEDSSPKFSIQLGDVAELKKVGDLGWKSQLVVSGMGIDIIDGMRLVKTNGETITLKNVARRDEMFNRLIALSQNMGFLLKGFPTIYASWYKVYGGKPIRPADTR